MRSDMDKVWSRWTPRYLTEFWKKMSESKIRIESLSMWLNREAVPTIIASGLSVFNISLLLSIQCEIAQIHSWTDVIVEPISSGAPDCDIWVSSTYLWKEQLCLWITSESDFEYSVNKTDPSIEPCRTPYKRRGLLLLAMAKETWNNLNAKIYNMVLVSSVGKGSHS